MIELKTDDLRWVSGGYDSGTTYNYDESWGTLTDFDFSDYEDWLNNTEDYSESLNSQFGDFDFSDLDLSFDMSIGGIDFLHFGVDNYNPIDFDFVLPTQDWNYSTPSGDYALDVVVSGHMTVEPFTADVGVSWSFDVPFLGTFDINLANFSISFHGKN